MAEEKKSALQHWPVILMVLLVAAIFLIKLLTYQINTTDYAIVLRFGQPQSAEARSRDPGLHLKAPWETVWRQDNRIQTFEGNMGEFEEVMTADGNNIVVSLFVGWKIGDTPEKQQKFMELFSDLDAAADQLTELLRNAKSIFGQYKFENLVNTDPGLVQLEAVEKQMRESIAADAVRYGIDITVVGIRHLGFPDVVTTDVIARMQAERRTLSAATLAEGEAEATKITADADAARQAEIDKAEATASGILADAELQIQQLFDVFDEEPELAAQLLRMESIKELSADGLTVIWDFEQEPWIMFKKAAKLWQQQKQN